MQFGPLPLSRLPGMADFPLLSPLSSAFHPPVTPHPALHTPQHPMFRFPAPPPRFLFPGSAAAFHMRYMVGGGLRGLPPHPNSPSRMSACLGAPGGLLGHSNSPISTSDGAELLKMSPRPGRKSRAKEEKLCGVCGDRAFGYNFDAISCESCKAFFRRNALKGLNSFRCSNEGRCVMSVVSRRFCKFCRLRKCFHIGMKREYILSETEKAEKRRNINRNRLVRELESRGFLPKDLTPGELDDRDLLNQDEISAIDEVERAFFASIQAKDEADTPPKTREHGQSHPCYEDLIVLAEVSFRCVIDMAKRISVFKALNQSDQIGLLKAGSVELLVLHNLICSRPDKENGVNELSSCPDASQPSSFSIENFISNSTSGTPKSVFGSLWNSLLGDLHCNSTQLILLLIVCLFSPDRLPSESADRDLVEEAQVRYSLLLGKYLSTRYTLREARLLFPHFMGKLVDLRDLSQEFSQQMVESRGEQVIKPLVNDLFGTSKPRSATSPASTSSDSISGMDVEVEVEVEEGEDDSQPVAKAEIDEK